MKVKIFIPVVVVVIVSIVAGIAIHSYRHISNTELFELRDSLSHMRHLNSVLVQDVLALRLGIRQNYHRISQTSQQINALIDEVQGSSLNANDDVFFTKFATFAISLRDQQRIIERFKIQNARYRIAQIQLLALKTHINDRREAWAFSTSLANAWNEFNRETASQNPKRLLTADHTSELTRYLSDPGRPVAPAVKPLLARAAKIGGLFLSADQQAHRLIRELNSEYITAPWADITALIEDRLVAQKGALVARNTKLLYLAVALSVIVILALVWLTASLVKLSRGKAELEIAVADRTAELEEKKRALEAHRDTLEQTVQERTMDLNKKAQDYITALIKESRVNKLQRDFVSMVSHEFRTPLSIIDMSAQRIARKNEKTGLSPDAVVDFVKVLRSNVRRLTNMVDRSLNISKFDAGAMDFRLEQIDIRILILEICHHQKGLGGDVRIYTRLDGLPDEMDADYDMIYHIFSNLIGNAIKYSPNGGAVVVRGTAVGDTAKIEIIDQGIGIPEDDLPKLFQRYFRASNAVQISGTGIGLVIVKEMIERHRGTLKVISAEGLGSAFIVTLPIAAADGVATPEHPPEPQEPAPALPAIASG